MSTPMLTQVAALKREAGDAILFTRMGDFFELHGEDAVRAAPVLEVALTVRGRGTEFETPMCGVPHFALESYLPKLLAAGYSAAIAEPTAKPEEVKGLLPRAITRIITPGTWLDDDCPLAGFGAPAGRALGPGPAAAGLGPAAGHPGRKGGNCWPPPWSGWRPRS